MRVLRFAAASVIAASTACAQWQEFGPAPIDELLYSGRVSALATHPTDASIVYAAGADAGIWMTADAGATWTPVTNSLATSAFGALVVDPTNPRVIYAGSGEGNHANHSRYGVGIFKSTDAGATWTQLAAGTFSGRCFTKLAIDPASPNRLYASITRAGGFPELAAAKLHPQREGPLGIFRSEDGGVNWTHLTNGIPAQSGTDIAIDPSNPAVVYAAIGRIFGASENGVYKSLDHGASWTKLGGGLPGGTLGRISIAVAPTQPALIYALVTNPCNSAGGGASTLGAFRSDNGGATWSTISPGNIQSSYGWYLSVVSVSPTDPGTVFMGGLDLVRSTNAGANWSFVTPPHVDMHALAWDASGRLWAGDDGGVQRTSNLGNSWTSRNEGLGSIQLYAGLSIHPTDASVVLGGMQDNGTNIRRDASKRWEHILGGDGGWTQLDRTRPDRLFAEYQGTGGINKSTDGGRSFFWIGDGIDGADRNCFLPPFVIDPSNADRMLYATHRVYESTVGGGDWTAISGDLTNGQGAIRAIAIAPSDARVVYAATNDGRVLASPDGGRTFTLVLSGNPGWPRVTREIEVHPHDARTVYLAGAGFGAVKVRRSRDGGSAWEPLDAGLPDTPVNVVEIDPRGVFPALYAGADTGVFRSIDDGATWTRLDGMPTACVIDLALDIPRGRLLASTQGRGVWSAPISCGADFNRDGLANVFDFLAFQTAFGGDSLSADFDGSGSLDVFDFLAFQTAFGEGC